MNVHDYLVDVIRSGAYGSSKWVISVMSITMPDPNADYAPYQAVLVDNAFWAFYDPYKEGLEPLDGLDPNVPVFRPDDPITLYPGDYPGLAAAIETTFGRILTNCYYFLKEYGDRAAFVNKEFNDDLLKDMFRDTVVDDDDPLGTRPGYYTTSGFKRCIDNGYALTGFAKLCVPTACPETMYPPKWLLEMRDELFARNRDSLNDPEVFAGIQTQLLDAYRKFLMSTPSAKFFVGKKTIDDAFNKMFISWGIEGSFGKDTVITNSLYEGWDFSKYAAMASSGIEASYSRGAATADGGEKVKILIRATQNILITDDDCGTSLGVPWDITEANASSFIGSYVLNQDATSTLITGDNYRTYVGKLAFIRSPTLCKKSHGDTCKYCAGSHNSTNPRGMSSGVSAVGSKIMLASMKAMHKGSKIQLAELDMDEIFF